MEPKALLQAWRSEPSEAERFLDEAVAALSGTANPPARRTDWIDWLEASARPEFLQALPDDSSRRRWADHAIAVIDAVDYTLEDMLAGRVAEIPNHPLFVDREGTGSTTWSYAQVHRRVRAMAAALLHRRERAPVVAILTDNCLEGACCDLACLLHDIVVSPLNVHSDVDQLVWILDRLGADVVIAGSDEHIRRLLEVRVRTRRRFDVIALRDGRYVQRGEVTLLDERAAELSPEKIEGTLAARSRLQADEPATVMFTSGSTGHPKGVVFSRRNLVTKRFARAAALPAVGHDEVLVCYLPLFHTFGRFLEMLGMVFWRGTYVFVGSPTLGGLLEGMREAKPTGLISIPLRWSQIRDQVHQRMDDAKDPSERAAAFNAITGGRLRWGLSAAGYLDPRVFRFFHDHQVALGSGFGMTEATGGITMSPPGDYVENTVGRALPGIRVELDEKGEMRIAGPYVARYLEPEGEGLECEPRIEDKGEEWIATGDLFHELEREHLTIVDRVKDIYKNDRGQTVAPQRAERALDGVPGVERCFLVGDHRSWNVMLIVPDRADPVLTAMANADEEREYFRRILNAANLTLAPYERAVDFALLDRDFDADRGELTAKRTFRRKQIEKNFAPLIEELYRNPVVKRQVGEWTLRIPRWVLRDIGSFESDLEVEGSALVDRRRNLRLELGTQGARLRLGHLAYRLEGREVDLGLFARQPKLWLGNAELAAFLPCKNGWEVPHPRVGDDAVIAFGATAPIDPSTSATGEEARLHPELCALVDPGPAALEMLRRLAARLSGLDPRIGEIVRARLIALSAHPEEEVRCLAYQTLLLDEASIEKDPGFAAFLETGQTFLNEASIQTIAASSLGPRRLGALRRRLAQDRERVEWPASEVVRSQLQQVLRLLCDFVRHEPYYYKPVRVELASWLLLEEDPALAQFARTQLEQLVTWFEARLEARHTPLGGEAWRDIVEFDREIGSPVRDRVEELFARTAFLEQAIYLIFEDEEFQLADIADGGLWISRVRAQGTFQLLRASVKTRRDRHYDILVILRDDMDAEAALHTNFWMLAIGGHPRGQRALPRFGCVRPELAAMALEFIRDLTVEERVRGLAAAGRVDHRRAEISDWRRLFVRAMMAFFRAWTHSGERILPGHISPSNVVVPEQDFREGPMVLSLADWRPYEGPLSLVMPLYRHFYRKTRAQIAGAERVVPVEWIFEACREALGRKRGRAFLEELAGELRRNEEETSELASALETFLGSLDTKAWVSVTVQSAIDRYRDWLRVNPLATDEARMEQIERLIPLYRLDRRGEIARYQLFLDTAFARSHGDLRAMLSRLIDQLHLEPRVPALQRVEISELQALLSTADEREAFRRMVFPRAAAGFEPEVVLFGDAEHQQVTVRTRVVDRVGTSFEARDPIDPGEIGQLYRLFFRRRFPKSVSEFDRYLLALDDEGRLVAGICFQRSRPEVVHMDGVVVMPALEGRGLASALLEDFCRRQFEAGVRVVQTTYFMRSFCEKRGFELNPGWSGLVRFLVPPEVTTDAPAE